MKFRIVLVIILSAVLMSGCAHERIVYRDTPKPVYVVPNPPEIQRPVLATETLTPEQQQNPGLVLQAQTAAVEQLHGYIDELEAIVKKYRDLATVSAEQLRQIIAEHQASSTSEQPRSLTRNLNSATTEEWGDILRSEQDDKKKPND